MYRGFVVRDLLITSIMIHKVTEEILAINQMKSMSLSLNK